MKNFKLTIEYDGTDFNGWQIQAAGRTVQKTIEQAISTMTRSRVRVTGSGRTDAGVHALGQVAAFRCDTRLSAEAFFSGLNSLLPGDIVIHSCEAVHESFHPRFDATAKTYIYRILNRPLAPAIGRTYCWHVKKPLDLSAMEEAARHLTGTHDFKGFENTGSPRSHTVRSVSEACFTTEPFGQHIPAAPFPDAPQPPMRFAGASDGVIVSLRITADGFLRYMVRNITATLVDIGLSRRPPEDVNRILEQKNRALASPTAPPHGLFLSSVQYPQSRHRPMRYVEAP